jgi:hypothetical protein
VKREEEKIAVILEEVLSPISVMDVPIEDGNALQPLRCTERGGSDGDVVEQAESHRALVLRVVARGADERETGPKLAASDALRELDRASGRKARNLERARRAVRVRV